MEASRTVREKVASLLGRPDEVLLEIGAGGELLVARLRVVMDRWRGGGHADLAVRTARWARRTAWTRSFRRWRRPHCSIAATTGWSALPAAVSV